MTDPTSPPSFFSPLETYYRNLYQSTYEVVSDTVYHRLSEAAKLEPLPGGVFKTGGQTFAKSAICSLFPDKCAWEFANYISYELPKTALETSASLAFWGGKKILNIAHSTFRAIKPPAPGLGLETDNQVVQTFSTICSLAEKQIEKLSFTATSYVLNKPVDDLIKKINNNIRLSQAMGDPPPIPFKAIDLLGPSLLLSLCVNKAIENFHDATTSAFNLITGKRLIAHQYKTQAANCTMIGGCPISISKTKSYTWNQLLTDSVMQTAFTALWSTGAYCAYNSIYNAVETAAESSEQAAFIANAILTGAILAPTVFSWMKDAINEKPSSNKNGPSIAPHLEYINSADFDPYQYVPENKKSLSKSSQNLTFEDAIVAISKT